MSLNNSSKGFLFLAPTFPTWGGTILRLPGIAVAVCVGPFHSSNLPKYPYNASAAAKNGSTGEIAGRCGASDLFCLHLADG